ncbi:arginyl-tRNA synthetase [Naumannella cuiyingiana]|uniref:Arginine--tRNA ligase n=1 Tax=Naumannella cuiyingiana TaxID=1347891 RepID=A0A7Z0IKP7_9ACTN|nr:arginine--tRNA ligase [Naumannella cuiyingiana]NYI70834.1 arginyl-tRNA synthetase [Naumannella cuiyingiana]
MSSLPALLGARFRAAAELDPELRPATKPQFGHFQSNVALRLAKAEGANPREIAQRLVDQIDVADIAEPLEIAGPGFINIRLRADVLAAEAERVRTDPANGLVITDSPQTVVIDYPSANVAKQMHVGHLRTSIIGDCFNRVLTALGHTVIPQDHMGDWGRQFGMLVEQVLDEGADASALGLAESEALYKRAQARFNDDPAFADRARKRVVALQSGDPATLEIWRALVDASRRGLMESYRRLGILVELDDFDGESRYNDALPGVVDELESRGIAVIDQGALCVFVDGYAAPMIVRNRDGGFGYSATDLAAIRLRVDELGADRVLYVVDARQSDHFGQVFSVARTAGWLPDRVEARHTPFGMVLGTDGKPLKTRDGSTATLESLLDAAETEATPEIALAAIKYADLSNSLIKDYVFDLDRMVRTTGDTGPYLQYAHARCNQVLRRAEAEGYATGPVSVLGEPAEQQLALQLTRFDDAVQEVAAGLQPHKLTTYLYELAELFSTFYEQCPVLKSTDPVRASRLGLTQATKDVLAAGLDMLGITAPERM